MTVETLVLIHQPSELKQALDLYPLSESTTYCTLTPQAMWACDKQNIKYSVLERYLTDLDLKNIGDEVHANILKIIKISDQYLESLNLHTPYISPFRASFHRLAVLIGGARIRLMYLEALIERNCPKRIVWFGKSAKVLCEYKSDKAYSDEGSIEIALLRYFKNSNIEQIDHSDDVLSKVFIERQEITHAQNALAKWNSFLNVRVAKVRRKISFWIKLILFCRLNLFKSLFLQDSINIILESQNRNWLKTLKILLESGFRVFPAIDYFTFLDSWNEKDEKVISGLKDYLYESGAFE